MVNKFRPWALNSKPKCLSQRRLMVSTTFMVGREKRGGLHVSVHVCGHAHMSTVTVKDRFLKVATKTLQAYF